MPLRTELPIMASRASGKGVRIRGGYRAAYYVGIETSMPAVPGLPAPVKALAVVPFGMEEGSRVRNAAARVRADRRRACRVPLLFFPSRKNDAPGSLHRRIRRRTRRTLADRSLPAAAQRCAREEVVPVTLESNVTETGMLQLWCVAADGRRWKLEFNVREREAAA